MQRGCGVSPGKAAAIFFGVPSSVTGCKYRISWKHSVTELETPKNMAAALPRMTLQPLYSFLVFTAQAVSTVLHNG